MIANHGFLTMELLRIEQEGIPIPHFNPVFRTCHYNQSLQSITNCNQSPGKQNAPPSPNHESWLVWTSSLSATQQSNKHIIGQTDCRPRRQTAHTVNKQASRQASNKHSASSLKWKEPVWAVKKAPLEQWADKCERVALAVNKPFWRRSRWPVASTSLARESTCDNASLILLLKPWNCLLRPTNAYRTTMGEWFEMNWIEL